MCALACYRMLCQPQIARMLWVRLLVSLQEASISNAMEQQYHCYTSKTLSPLLLFFICLSLSIKQCQSKGAATRGAAAGTISSVT